MKKVEIKNEFAISKEKFLELVGEYKEVEWKGDGIYEVMIGCRGFIDDVVKNDEFVTLEELVEKDWEYDKEELEEDGISKEEFKDMIEEFYWEDGEFDFGDGVNGYLVSFYEDSCSEFYLVKE